MSNIDWIHDSLGLALGRIYDTWGAEASIVAKDKVLDKFGFNPDLDAITLATRATVGTLQASGGANETLQTTNSITHLVAGSGDTMRVRVEGHYITAAGDMVFVVQNKVLTAATPVALDQALARCSRLYVAQGGIPTGPISATIGSGGTAVTRIAAGDVQTQKAATTISYADFYLITRWGVQSFGTGSATVRFRLEERPLFDSDGTAFTSPNWRPLTHDIQLPAGQTVQYQLDHPIIVGPNTDIRISAWGSSANRIVGADFDGYLAIDLNAASAAAAA